MNIEGLDFKDEIKATDNLSNGLPLPSTNRVGAKQLKKDVTELDMEEVQSEDLQSLSIALNAGDYTNYASALEGCDVNSYTTEDSGKSIGIKNANASDINLAAAFSSALGLGGLYQFPLYHTGIWISLTAIGNDELFNLEALLAEEAVELGRRTNSLIYSNHNVVKNRIILDFIMRHIHTTTVKVSNKYELMDLIVMQDLYPLVRGLQASIYTDGIESNITCSNSNVLIDKKPVCNNSFHAVLAPKKMLRTDFERLTEEQTLFMQKRSPNSTTLEEVKVYQKGYTTDEGVIVNGVMVDTEKEAKSDNDMKVVLTLTAPTLREHVDAGTAWIDGITASLKEIIQSKDEQEINLRVDLAARVSLIRTYIHFIKAIEIPELNLKADNPKSVRLALANIMSDKVLFNNMMTAIKEYINDSTFSIVAINKFTCKSCLEKQDTTESPMEELIPINAVKSFLTLLALKTEQIIDNSDTY